MLPTARPPIVPPFPRASRLVTGGQMPHAPRSQGVALTADAAVPTIPASNESLIDALTDSGAFRVLRRLTAQARYHDPRGAATHTALYVDVETTGLDHTKDRIIQLAITPFTFTADGRVCDVATSESWFDDPGVPIDPAITRLTGITDADVRGQRIDEARVSALLRDAVLVIAHNAQFDRPFLEQRFNAFVTTPWGCSMAEVPWIEEGLPTTKLQWLAECHAGVFYDAHRADIDTLAGVHLLASALPSGRLAMAALLERVRQKTLRVWALATPFVTKDVLKARGYRWNGGESGGPKAWWRDVPEDDVAAEEAWLTTTVYGDATCRAHVQRFGPKVRYSARIGGLRMQSLRRAA